MELGDIIMQCRTGNFDSFEELYKQFYKKAYGTAYNICGNKSNAEDIVQEAFIICYRSIKQLKDPQYFSTWFYRIIIRLSWRMAKKLKTITYDSNSDDGNPYLLYDTADSICSNLVIKQKILSMKLPLRTVLILYYYNDMPVKEISRVLGCLEGTVKSRLYKARKILKHELIPACTGKLENNGFKEVELNEWVR